MLQPHDRCQVCLSQEAYRDEDALDQLHFCFEEVIQILLFGEEEQQQENVNEHERVPEHFDGHGSEQENLSSSVREQELSEAFRVCFCAACDEISCHK